MPCISVSLGRYNGIVYVRLGCNRTSRERKQIVVGLKCEYPFVGCGYPPHSALSEFFRKCEHNQVAQLKRQLLEKPKSTPSTSPARSSNSLHPANIFHDRFVTCRQYVKSLDGKIRSKYTFQKYPQLKDVDVGIAEMALI